MIEHNFWKRRNVFVTGATGLLGSTMTKQLVDKGANVVVLVRDVVPYSNYFLMGLDKRTTQVKGDFVDYRVVERTLNEYEIDTVFHLGAQTIVGTANRSPLSTFESNIKGTWNVMEACRNSKGVNRVVFASSDKAYGSQETLPYTEEAPLEGEHPYDVSKSCSDLIAQSYFKTYGLPVSITRCGNLYGGGDLNFNRIIPGTIRSVYYNESPIIRSDGSLERDYFYLPDAAAAYIALAEQVHKPGVKGEAFNFGTNRPMSVIALVRKILEVMGSTIQPTVLNNTSGEIGAQYLSSEKAHRVLGWRHKYSVEEGLRETVAWYKAFLDRNKV